MPRRRNSFNDARQALRLAAITYAEALQGTVRAGSAAGLRQLSVVDQVLQEAAVDFAAIAQLRLASEDKKRKAGP